jgi:hypothetical protein
MIRSANNKTSGKQYSTRQSVYLGEIYLFSCKMSRKFNSTLSSMSSFLCQVTLLNDTVGDAHSNNMIPFDASGNGQVKPIMERDKERANQTYRKSPASLTKGSLNLFNKAIRIMLTMRKSCWTLYCGRV